MSDVIVVGFPKSGNTWLARLMGDALHRPIRGTDTARPLAAEGEERGAGRGIVQQLHLVPPDKGDEVDERRYPGFVSSPWHVNPNCYNGEHVIHIIRDPRDVSISVNAYWGRENLNDTITEVVGAGGWPLWGTSWEKFVNLWRSSSDVPHVETRYEWLHADPLKEITRLLNLFVLKPANDLETVVQRQSFEERKAQIDRDGENMPHGITAQRKNLRKGSVGDWRETMTHEQKRLCFVAFGHMLIELGYESSPLWWCDNQERNEASMFEVLNALYSLTDTGAELCRTLYRLTENIDGEIVELGAGRGRTAIALGWRSGNSVVSVDDYADNVDWANNIYGAEARRDYLANTRKAGVSSTLIQRESLAEAMQWSKPIGLWCWDISSRDRLLNDWQAWRDKVRGKALIRDTFDYGLGSREVIDYEAGRGEFEIERDDPGILILRRL